MSSNSNKVKKFQLIAFYLLLLISKYLHQIRELMETLCIKSLTVELDMMSIQIHSSFQEAWLPEDNAKHLSAASEKNQALDMKVLNH